jgi:hypothetical protein
VAASVLLDLALAFSQWVWAGVLVLASASAARSPGVRLKRYLERSCAWRSLRWIVAGSLVLSLAGVGWGLPGSWVPIEVTPGYVLDAFPDLVGARQETVVFSTLRNINPTIEIFRRDVSASRVAAEPLR